MSILGYSTYTRCLKINYAAHCTWISDSCLFQHSVVKLLPHFLWLWQICVKKNSPFFSGEMGGLFTLLPVQRRGEEVAGLPGSLESKRWGTRRLPALSPDCANSTNRGPEGRAVLPHRPRGRQSEVKVSSGWLPPRQGASVAFLSRHLVIRQPSVAFLSLGKQHSDRRLHFTLRPPGAHLSPDSPLWWHQTWWGGAASSTAWPLPGPAGVLRNNFTFWGTSTHEFEAHNSTCKRKGMIVSDLGKTDVFPYLCKN